MNRPDWTVNRIKPSINLSTNVHYDKIIIQMAEQLLRSSDIHDYPNDYACYKAISDHYQLSIDKLAIGFGSTEIIERILRALKISKLYILTPTYEMLPIYCENNNIEYVLVSNLDEIKDSTNAVVYIVNPNGNDGSILDLTPIYKQFKYCIVDEVYSDFNQRFSLLHHTSPNLIVIKSLSKSLGLAGLRLGFCTSTTNNIKLIQQLRHSYVTTSISNILVPKLINETDNVVYRMLESKIYLERRYNCLPSNGNYVLFTQPNILTETFGCKIVNNAYRMALADKGLLSSVTD